MTLKRLWFDIECSDLNANWGSTFSIAWQREGRKRQVLKVNDFPGWKSWDDRRLLQEFLKVLASEETGVVIGHNIILFDIPFLQARMLHHGLGAMPQFATVDTYFLAKSKLKIRGKSLESVAEFLGCPYRKTYLDKEVWRRAGRGDADALDYVAKHNLADVRVTRWVYEKLAPTMKRHPVIADYGSCHVCGKNALERRGYATTVLRGKQIRYHCTNCGSWTTRPEPKVKQ